jgi:hypothetical protein
MKREEAKKISRSPQYNHQFVFVKWDIEKAQLFVYSEFKKTATLIMERNFNLNI